MKKASSRQRPVSCYFCRSRKLRCSRRFPCPNCTSRGISCQLYTSQPIEIQAGDRLSGSTSVQNTDVLARLQRLEDIVLRKSETSRPYADADPETFPKSPRNTWREQHATEDARWLELECSIQGVSSVLEPDRVVFRTCTIRQIQSASSILSSGSSAIISSDNAMKCFWVPLYEESRCLVEKYIADLTCLLHVVHIPSLKAMVSQVYQELRLQISPRPSYVALLMSIIATTLYSWASRDSGPWLSLTAEDMNRCAHTWLKATLALLEYSQTLDGSLEEIQARIITSSIVCNLEGVSPRYRGLILSAITRARESRLHRLDHEDGSTTGNHSSGDMVEAEIGRRVWWYLAVTDWVLSLYEGPLKGTYTINPRQMSVKKPRNINDADLVSGKTVMERTMDYPTHVSYTLQRIQLGEICRELTDRTSFFGSDPSDYDVVLENDKKTGEYIKAFPSFFRLDGGSLKDIAAINPDIAPGIIIQRYIVNVLAHAHRCRLHLPYFARGSVNSKYICSRAICLNAARTVIHAERLFERESVSFVPTRFRFAGSIHCLCMAIIVFVLDLCLYKGEGQEEERKREAADACSILQKAKSDSSIAAKLLQSFMHIIRKHKVSIQGIGNANLGEAGETSHQVSADLGAGEVAGPSFSSNFPDLSTDQGLLNPQSSYWNGILETFDGGMEDIDWNALFFDLDAQSLDGKSLL
ncbi:hypothetical protein BDV12DRAFT_51062 [Aspergillus spectabilis]